MALIGMVLDVVVVPHCIVSNEDQSRILLISRTILDVYQMRTVPSYFARP